MKDYRIKIEIDVQALDNFQACYNAIQVIKQGKICFNVKEYGTMFWKEIILSNENLKKIKKKFSKRSNL